MLADDLDLPQVQAGVMHDLLSLGHPVTGRGLRDLALRARLLYEDQVGRAGVPGRITMRLHTLYDAGALPAVPRAAMAYGTPEPGERLP